MQFYNNCCRVLCNVFRFYNGFCRVMTSEQLYRLLIYKSPWHNGLIRPFIHTLSVCRSDISPSNVVENNSLLTGSTKSLVEQHAFRLLSTMIFVETDLQAVQSTICSDVEVLETVICA